MKQRALFVAALTVLIAVVAIPTALGHYWGSTNGGWADSATHTWWDGAARSYDVPIWGPINSDVMYNEIETKTVIDTVKVAYHYKSSLTYKYVDISWWAADLVIGVGGSSTCNKALSSNRCDHFHVIYDDDPGQSSNEKRQKVCHELMHTLGSDDGGSSGGCQGGGSNGTMNSHDIGHINDYYAH